MSTPEGVPGNRPGRMLLIINPVSGKKLVIRYIPQIIRIFMDAGYIVTTMVTARRGDAAEFAAAYGGEYDLICCTGGDGTLNETVSGLARVGLDRPVGYIPCGSTNDFAAAHGLSVDIPTAAQNIALGRKRRFDIGRFGEEYFNYVAAFGAFSWLSYTTDQNLKNMLGHAAYILDGVKDLSKIKPMHVKLTADGRVFEGDYIFGAVCNSTSIAGTIELPAEEVDTCDGIFELLLIQYPKNISELDIIVRGVLAKDYSSPYVDFVHAREIYIDCSDGVEWTIDGEASRSGSGMIISPMPGFLELQG